MPRPCIDYPKDIELETSTGTISIAVTSRSHIRVSSNLKNHEQYLTVNRVEYYISMHFYRQADGSFEINDKESYIQRAGYYSSDGRPTPSALEKLKKAIIPAVNKWAKANPGVLEEAEYAYFNNKLMGLEEHVEKAQKELRVCQDALQQELDKNQHLKLPPSVVPFADIQLPEHTWPEGSETDLLHKIVKACIPKFFIESHVKTGDAEELKLEALGILVAKFCEWCGTDVLEVCAYALEDANFHAEAKEVKQIVERIEGTQL